MNKTDEAIKTGDNSFVDEVAEFSESMCQSLKAWSEARSLVSIQLPPSKRDIFFDEDGKNYHA